MDSSGPWVEERGRVVDPHPLGTHVGRVLRLCGVSSFELDGHSRSEEHAPHCASSSVSYDRTSAPTRRRRWDDTKRSILA